MSDNSIGDQKEYSEKEKIESGLMAVFPTLEVYQRFILEDQGDIKTFIRLAREYGIIGESKNRKAFEAFIRKNSRTPDQCAPPQGLTLSELLEDREKIGASVRGLTNWINKLIKKFALNHMMPAGKVSNAMFSRLVREPANTSIKRNTLRLLSFWFGYKRPHLGPSWNFETLLKLCPNEQKAMSSKGVRIAFDLHSRGDVIDDITVKCLKSDLRNCIKDLGYLQNNKIQSYSTTSFYLDLPKRTTAQEGVNHPMSYGRCVRDAISIAHQLSIRWALCPHSSPRRILTIGIAAGEFSNLDLYIQSILNVRLQGNSTIRVTDYTRLCVLANDIRAEFCQRPKEIEMPNGETMTVWWVTGLWNTNFWDFVPGLLKDKMLQTDSQSAEELRRLLWFPDEKEKLSDSDKERNAIAIFFKSPQNSLLGLEIAKTLYFRRRFFEANEILRVILSTEPSNLNAGVLRMAIFQNLGIEASSYSVSEIQFKRAEQESALIEEICITKDEDYYCEYGVGKLGQTMTILRLIKRRGGEYEEEDIKFTKEDVYRLLNEAENIFLKGMTISPTGHRSTYFLMCVRSLRGILERDEDFFKDPDRPMLDKNDICKKTTQDIYSALGWLRKDDPEDIRYYVLEKKLAHAIGVYNDSVSLRTSIPNVKFCCAAALWDFSPIITVGIAKKVIEWLKQSSNLAKRLEKYNLYLMSFIRFKRELLPVDTFVKYVQNAINEIEARTGKLEDLESKEETDPIDPDRLDGLKLFCLHI